MIHINNLMIFIKTDDQNKYNRIMCKILWKLKENNLFEEPKKCFFSKKEVEFFGMMVDVNKIKMNDSKIKATLK